MSNLTVIENKISAVKKYLTILQRYEKYTQEEIEHDVDIKGALERYLYLAVQATIDLAEAIIAYKRYRKPTTMREGFVILQEEQVITPVLVKKMVQMTGFRNIITHDYETVDFRIVYDILHEGVNDIQKFIQTISDKILNPPQA